MSLKKSEILAKLFKEYGLYFDSENPNSKDNDVFSHKHYKIITRSGIEKIQKGANIHITYVPVYCDAATVVLLARGTRVSKDGTNEVVETFASASKDTSSNAYYAEMAEKRAMSRVVLKLAGLYEYGVYGADEAEEFDKVTKGDSDGPRASYKPNK